jgi:hypothetical protein
MSTSRRASSRRRPTAREVNDATCNHEQLCKQTNFTINELAAYLRRSPRAAYMWAYRHRIPHGYVGRRLLFSRRIVDRIVHSGVE